VEYVASHIGSLRPYPRPVPNLSEVGHLSAASLSPASRGPAQIAIEPDFAIWPLSRGQDRDMTRYAAFLRGVNVGGANLKMAAVAKAFEEAGFTNVRTILASGNVLLESGSGVEAVRRKAERAWRDAFGYDAWVLAYQM